MPRWRSQEREGVCGERNQDACAGLLWLRYVVAQNAIRSEHFCGQLRAEVEAQMDLRELVGDPENDLSSVATPSLSRSLSREARPNSFGRP